MSAQTHQVGAHFEASNEGVLVAVLKSFENFSLFQASLPGCVPDFKILFRFNKVHSGATSETRRGEMGCRHTLVYSQGFYTTTTKAFLWHPV